MSTFPPRPVFDTTVSPQPLPHKLPDSIRIVLTDFDDTITTNGTLLPETFAELSRAASAGLKIIVVTGGCAGWCDHIARTWPVSAVIGEGGGFCIHRKDNGQLTYEFWEDRKTQIERQHYVHDKIRQYIKRSQNQFQFATDQIYRLVDVAVDIGQDVETPPSIAAQIELIKELHTLGIQAKSSSIHINAWIGDFDKYAMSNRILSNYFGLGIHDMRSQVLAIGDSPNDEPLFRNFPYSVGVANIQPQLINMISHPKWITHLHGGLGLAETLRTINPKT